MKGIIYTKDIYREIVPKIIQDEASWSSFLNFSAVHYQMGFENASLLYAQRPDAEMVETYSGWREKGRYVRKGSKGIAVIDSSHYRPYVDHVFDISDTNGRGRPEIWRLDKENEKEILSLLHAKSDNVQGYVREAVESEIYGKDRNYIENISDLCRCHDSQNPEHIYDITKAVIQSAQYMAAVRIRAEPPPVSSLLPVLATAPRLMVYGLCSTALSVAGQVLKGIEQVFEMKREKQRAEIGLETGKEHGIERSEKSTEKGTAGHGIPAIRHQPYQDADTHKRQGNGSHKGTEKAGYEQLSLSFDGGYAFCDCGRAL
ncbi:MAG: hypothetical protein HFI00_09395 [Lachnospiraceae bacterium]|jgi:hypothetical protein|nr:hypothetical protein [Lachnospiraceae bacterium]